eukprot:gene16924-19288_t
MEPLYRELKNQHIPSRHSASLPLLKVKYLVLHYQYLDSGPRVVSALQEAVLACVDALENICTYPGEFLSSELTGVVTNCSKICFKPVFPPLMEKALCLKALRMHLLLYGRETRHFILDNVSAKCHERLPSTGFLGPQITQGFNEIVDEHRQDEMEPLYKQLQTMKIPSRHAASLPLLRVKWRVLHKLYQDSCPSFQSELQEAVNGYVFALENICTYPGEILSAELIMIAAHCSQFCPKPVFPPGQEKELCLKTLRMQLLLLGRDTRESVLDDISTKCHERLPAAGSS